MAEEEFAAGRPQQRVKQQISVPYLWEEKPGKAKKEWISTSPDTMDSSPSPSRLVVSVPFEWEEKPGKPLQPPQLLPERPPCCLSPPPDHFRPFDFYQNPFMDEKVHSSNPFLDENEGSVFAEEVEAFPFETSNGTFDFPLPLPPDDHLRKDQCFMNSTVSHENLSNNCSIHRENWFSASEVDGHSSWSSSAVDGHVTMDTPVMEFLFPLSSPDTGFLNNVCEQERDGRVTMDTSVMEFLFPLSSPDTGFLNNVCEQERAPIPPVANSDSKLANSCSTRKEAVAARRMLTLGELILLSRKLSYQLKQDDIKRSSYTMENIRKSVLTCLPFIPRVNKNASFIASW